MESTKASGELESLLRKRLFPSDSPSEAPLAVAYSGGKDSGVLLAVLVGLRTGVPLSAIHVDHGLRPHEERLAERRLVEANCQTWGVPLHTFGPPDEKYQSGSVEAWARSYRYDCFRECAARQPGTRILLAHHGQDQAETILIRLLQGRSWQGLSGMPASRGPFFRPFLDVPGTTLDRAARELGLSFWQDSTNQNPHFLRNRVRNEIFPLLTQIFPRAAEALGDFAEVWTSLAPKAQVDSRWQWGETEAKIPLATWQSWNPLERQAQLLAVSSRLVPQSRLARRFLETLAAVDSPRGRLGEGAGWRLFARSGLLTWERVVKVPTLQYLKRVRPDSAVTISQGVLQISSKEPKSAVALLVPTADPDLDLVVCSGGASVAQMWVRRHKSRYFGVEPGRRRGLVFAVQGGRVLAVLDFPGKRAIWQESSVGHLNGRGIFITLMVRSAYERRR